MKLGKMMKCLTFASISFVCISICQVAKNQDSYPAQEVRTVHYDKISFNDNSFDEFVNFDVVQNDDGINIKAEKTFDIQLFNELDFVDLNEENENFNVIYEINYVENEDTVFLSATIVNDDDQKIIDSIPGLVSINSIGEPDILFSVEDELIWLSDLTDSSVINNTGWFKKLFKKITNAIVKVTSNIVKVLEPIIRPAVKIATYFAIKLLGSDKAAYLGATLLNMKADTEGIYHADFNCWQQYFGYSDLYDVVFDSATSMRYGKFDFDVNDDGYTDYVLWAWKGNYLNLGAGAELGIYERWAYSDEIWKVNKNNAMKMTLKLEHKKKGILFDWQPEEKQWWITGFDPKTPNVNRDDLTATYTVEFTNMNMYECFKNQWKTRDKRWDFSNYKVPTLIL